MNEKMIRKGNDPILRKVALPIDNNIKTRYSIEDQLVKILKIVPKSAGLSAPQIGIGRRVVVIKTKAKVYTALYNPKIIWASPIQIDSNERCLSFSERYILKRSICLIYEFEDIKGRKKRKFCFYKRARVIEHEVDHLDGLCIDRGKKVLYEKR